MAQITVVLHKYSSIGDSVWIKLNVNGQFVYFARHYKVEALDKEKTLVYVLDLALLFMSLRLHIAYCPYS